MALLPISKAYSLRVCPCSSGQFGGIRIKYLKSDHKAPASVQGGRQLNLALQRQRRGNFFKDFFYDEWVTESFRENHSGAGYDIRDYERILADFDDLAPIEAGFAICWQQVNSGFFDVEEYVNYHLAALEWAKSSVYLGEDDVAKVEKSIRADVEDYRNSFAEKYESCWELLPDLVGKNRPEIQPGGYVLESHAIVYAHLAVGFALMLASSEGAQSERFWELIEDALRVIKTPKIEDIPAWCSERPDIREPLEISMLLVEAYIWSNLFQKHFRRNNFEQALDCLNRAADLCEEICDENSEAFHQESLNVFEWMAQRPKDYPGIQTIDIGAHLVTSIISAKDPVQAFERIFEEDSRSTNWKHIAKVCGSIGNIWELYGIGDGVFSEIRQEYTETVTYWQITQALAEQKIGPAAAVDYIRAAQDSEAVTRLRLYFFPEEWKNLPDKARASLISADREYERGDGRRPIIFDHLRSATRAIMVEKFWDPYREFLIAKARRGLKTGHALSPVLQIIEDEQAEPDLAPLLKAPDFEEFLGTISEDPRFLRRLPKKLTDLNVWANKVSHEHHWGYKGFDDQIRKTYAEFLGIGQSGILPRLMRLHPKADSYKA